MEPAKKKGILFDSTICVGCGACYQACKERNHLPQTTNDIFRDELSALTYTALKRRNGRFVRQLCMNCVDPACVSVCPVGALEKSQLGPVFYHPERCIGCRYCMLACPFSIPKYEWDKLLPLIRKCDMCFDRVAAGLPTACAEACPTGATKFGEREQLIEEARARIRGGNPKYVDYIYGLEEAGGTSVLLISDAPMGTLGYRTNLGKEPLPQLTWHVLQKIPSFVVLLGVLLGGIWWITNRRAEVQRAEAERKARESEKLKPEEPRIGQKVLGWLGRFFGR
jgi:formate dehydrogenase iron-sulfur subunit